MRALIHSNRYRYLHGKQFFPALITAVVTAFMNLAIVKLISNATLSLAPENFDVLYANGYYNFGVLKVESLQDLSNLSTEQLLSSAFAGGFLALILAIFIPIFICGSFKSGFVQDAYVRGNAKLTIIIAYVISALEIFFAIFVVYIFSLLIFSSIMMQTIISVSMLKDNLAMFARQLFAHFVYLSVSISSAFMINKSSACIIFLLFGVIAFPGLLSTADLIFQAEFKLASLWIVNIIGQWSQIPPTNTSVGLAVALATLIISLMTTFIVFLYSDFKH